MISPDRRRRVRRSRPGHRRRPRDVAPDRASRGRLRLKRCVGAVARARGRRRGRGRGARRAVGPEQRAPAARGAARRTSSRARCARASRWPTATRRSRGDPGRHRRSASAPARTTREIRDAYVAIYGEHILLTPSNGGLGVIAWGVPVVALVLGAAGSCSRSAAGAARRGSPRPPTTTRSSSGNADAPTRRRRGRGT